MTSKAVDHKSNQVDEDYVDLEELAKADKKPPKQQRYRIRIDKQKYDVDMPGMTGRELLKIAGKSPPEKYKIYEKKGKNQNPIGLDEYADFSKPGVERFNTLPIDQTDGSEPRREFLMPEEDRLYLESLDLSWETIREKNINRVVIHNYPIPEGYQVRSASLNVRLEGGYPASQIDMVYFYPALQLVSGKPIKALEPDQFDNKVWQRWSRHRTASNPWEPGVDNLERHLMLVNEWLLREIPAGALR